MSYLCAKSTHTQLWRAVTTMQERTVAPLRQSHRTS